MTLRHCLGYLMVLWPVLLIVIAGLVFLPYETLMVGVVGGGIVAFYAVGMWIFSKGFDIIVEETKKARLKQR